MLQWVIVFLVVALIGVALGLGGLASSASGAAQVFGGVFLSFLAISLIAGFIRNVS